MTLASNRPVLIFPSLQTTDHRTVRHIYLRPVAFGYQAESGSSMPEVPTLPCLVPSALVSSYPILYTREKGSHTLLTLSISCVPLERGPLFIWRLCNATKATGLLGRMVVCCRSCRASTRAAWDCRRFLDLHPRTTRPPHLHVSIASTSQLTYKYHINPLPSLTLELLDRFIIIRRSQHE